MKYLLTSFLCFLISSVFGQLQETYFQLPGGNVRMLPYLSNAIAGYEVSTCPFITQTDSISGDLVVVRNPDFDTTEMSNYVFARDPYCYLIYPNESSGVDLPPFLDSLRDGMYVQFYDALPIRDVDTIKWKHAIVAAVFEVENNRPIGEVSWYYPNGLLMQKGSYTNGLRDGEWFFQSIYPDNRSSKKTKNWLFDHSTTINYSNGSKNGMEHRFQQSYPYKKHHLIIHESWQNYNQDIPHGKYERRINGKLNTIGEYHNGKPAGKWEHYQWKDSVEYGKLIPRLVYTYAKDSTAVHFPVYLRGNFKHSSLVKSDQTLFSEPISMSYYEYYPDPYQFESIGENLSAYYQVPNCLNLSPSHKFDPLNVPDYLSSTNYSLYDSIGKHHSFRQAAITCGIVFSFSGILEEYYSNGQLKLHFDFDHPETLLNNTVYWENGRPMNRFQKTKTGNDWEQLWYSEQGKIIEHIIYDSLFKFKAKAVDPNYVTLNGKMYSRSGDLLSHTNSEHPRYSETGPVLIEEQRVLKKNQLIEQFHFYPSRRTGFKALGLNKPYKNVRWFTFDSTFTSVHFVDTISFGQLFSVVEVSDSIRNDLWYEYHQPLKNDTIHSGVIPFGDLSTTINMRCILYSGKPYTGKLNIRFSDQTKPRLSATKNGLMVSLNRNTDLALLVALFPNLSSILFGNNKSVFTDQSIDQGLLAALDELELKSIEIQLTNGILAGEVNCFSSNNRPLANLHYQAGLLSGKQTYYNNFPNTYRNVISHTYLQISADQTTENFKRNQVTQQVHYSSGVINGAELKMDLNGDTLSLYKFNNGALDGEQLTMGYQHTRNYVFRKNDAVVAERKVDQRTGITLMNWSSETGVYRSYHANGQLAQEFIDRNQIYDTIRCYDTLGSLTQKLCLTNRILDFAIFYENGERSSTIDFAIEDTLLYLFYDNGRIRYPIAKQVMTDKVVRGNYTYDNGYTGYLKKYNQYNEVEEEGMLTKSTKTGEWHYYQRNNNSHYCIHFSDSVKGNHFYNLRAGNVIFFDSVGKVISKGQLLDYSTEYSCLQRNYNEQFAVNYELYNSTTPPDTLMPVVHYYKTGVKMNEGNLLNGQAQGLWRWYHSDGSLYSLGNYNNGKRHGRWLEGDLSKVNFLGEYCLDPDKTDYTKLLSELEVTVIFYDHGKVMNVQNHQFRGTD